MNEALWYASRAAGIASIVLLTAVVVLGTVVAGRRRPHDDSATVAAATHRWLSLATLAFIGAHVATAVGETATTLSGPPTTLSGFLPRYSHTSVSAGYMRL